MRIARRDAMSRTSAGVPCVFALSVPSAPFGLLHG